MAPPQGVGPGRLGVGAERPACWETLPPTQGKNGTAGHPRPSHQVGLVFSPLPVFLKFPGRF